MAALLRLSSNRQLWTNTGISSGRSGQLTRVFSNTRKSSAAPNNNSNSKKEGKKWKQAGSSTDRLVFFICSAATVIGVAHSIANTRQEDSKSHQKLDLMKKQSKQLHEIIEELKKPSGEATKISENLDKKFK